MKGKSETDQGLQSLPIKDYSQVKIINGSKQGGDNLYCLMFNTKDGTQLAKVETSASQPYDKDFKIEDYEEIIGIYGWESPDIIRQLGFLIWKPPKL
jgi:hypothetical protein